MKILLPAAAVAVLSLQGCAGQAPGNSALPEGFVSLADLTQAVQLDIRYATENNFIGRPIAGYQAGSCVLTRPAASALIVAQRLAQAQGYALKVYDCYRPQQAVNDFVNWAADPDDLMQQHRFYPAVPKNELFARGYIAESSGHSRGSTVDLTLVPLGSEQPQANPLSGRYDCRRSKASRYPDNSLEMATGYDCFDELSRTDNDRIGVEARQNRQRLRSIMEAAGFANYPLEWWHYTLGNEPFADQYFDFPIK
jgi:D-alanyl-D-alanine dipeptidase